MTMPSLLLGLRIGSATPGCGQLVERLGMPAVSVRHDHQVALLGQVVEIATHVGWPQFQMLRYLMG